VKLFASEYIKFLYALVRTKIIPPLPEPAAPMTVATPVEGPR
jgi:hypothetical protein